jgi:GAF domain-containing protein/HAMP domain-containing protein
MRTRSGSIFYKILVVFIFLGLFPAGLLSARLLILNRDLLERGAENWTLPPEAVDQITNDLSDEAGVYLLYTLLVTGLTSIFISGGLIGPIHQLQQLVASFREGRIDESIDIKTGDEIEDVAVSFTQLARELTQTQKSLEGSITERAHDLEQRALQLQIAAQIARDTAAARDLEELLNRTVNMIRERFNFYYVGIFLIDDNHEYSVLRAATGEAGKAQLQRGYRLKVGDVGIVTYVASTGDLRIVNNVDFDFVYRRESLLPLTRSEAAIPLRIETEVIGVLDVQSTQVNAFAEGDIASLQILADQIAVAIQNARLVGELDSRLKEINLLYQRYTRESWSQQIGGEHVTGYQYDMSQVMPAQQQLPLDQLREGGVKTLPISNTSGEKKSTLIAPLRMYDQVVGVIGVESDEPSRQWTAEESSLVEAVSSQVALALDNARLLEETQKRAEQLRLLQEITSAAASHIEMGDLLDDIAKRLRAGFNLLYCRIVLFDVDGRHGTVLGSAFAPHAPVAAMVGMKVPLINNDITAAVINTKEAQLVNNVLQNPKLVRMVDDYRAWGVNSLAIVPLILRGSVIGTIDLDSADPNWKLSNDDLQLLSQISLQTATAVDIARSFQQTAQRAQQEKMLTGITSRMRETLDVETVLQTAVNEIYRSFNLDNVACYLGGNQTDGAEHAGAVMPKASKPKGKEA